jgi:probable HAF family extracellular repeat protein
MKASISGRVAAAFALAAAAASLAGVARAAPPSYTVTDLGTMPTGVDPAQPLAVASGGRVAGFEFTNSTGGDTAFLWTNGVFNALGTLGGNSSEAYDMNGSGQIAGVSSVATSCNGSLCSYADRPFSWQNGVMTNLDPGAGPDDYSGAFGINGFGSVAGFIHRANAPAPTAPEVPTIWSGGGAQGLPTFCVIFSGGTCTQNGGGRALAIADSGDAVGYSGATTGQLPVIWSAGAITSLGSLGGNWGEATDISNNGVVVGGSRIGPYPGPVHAFVWANGTMSDLGTLLGDTGSEAYSINDGGEIVGVSNTTDQFESPGVRAATGRAFLYVGGTMYDLNSLIPANSGWSLANAAAIDNDGAVVGFGFYNGVQHGYLLRPVVVDTTPPSVSCGSPDGQWHGSDVSIACTASDSGSGLANPGDASFSLTTSVPGGTETANASTNSRQVCDNAGNCTTAGPIAGNMVDKKAPATSCGSADGVWHAANVGIGCTASDGGSGLAFASDGSFSLSTSVPAGSEDANAATGSHAVCDNVGNCATAGPIGGNKIDRKAPAVSCGAADGVWHASNVSIGCTASDGGSGLANAGDGSFSLSTSVAAGTETANALTGSRQVCDSVGNCATAGPISGNKIDRKPPVITLTSPTNSVYLLHKAVAASFSCADGGAGVASCSGSVATGANIDTSSIGTRTFTVTATDAVGNSSSQTVSYTVSYDILLLYDPTKATTTISLQLRDGNGVNVSSASIVLTVQRIDSTPQSGTFTYTKSMNSYKYSLPKGLSSGSHMLYFTADSDPTLHSAGFTTR